MNIFDPKNQENRKNATNFFSYFFVKWNLIFVRSVKLAPRCHVIWVLFTVFAVRLSILYGFFLLLLLLVCRFCVCFFFFRLYSFQMHTEYTTLRVFLLFLYFFSAVYGFLLLLFIIYFWFHAQIHLIKYYCVCFCCCYYFYYFCSVFSINRNAQLNENCFDKSFFYYYLKVIYFCFIIREYL